MSNQTCSSLHTLKTSCSHSCKVFQLHARVHCTWFHSWNRGHNLKASINRFASYAGISRVGTLWSISRLCQLARYIFSHFWCVPQCTDSSVAFILCILFALDASKHPCWRMGKRGAVSTTVIVASTSAAAGTGIQQPDYAQPPHCQRRRTWQRDTNAKHPFSIITYNRSRAFRVATFLLIILYRN